MRFGFGGSRGWSTDRSTIYPHNVCFANSTVVSGSAAEQTPFQTGTRRLLLFRTGRSQQHGTTGTERTQRITSLGALSPPAFLPVHTANGERWRTGHGPRRMGPKSSALDPRAADRGLWRFTVPHLRDERRFMPRASLLWTKRTLAPALFGQPLSGCGGSKNILDQPRIRWGGPPLYSLTRFRLCSRL